MLISDRAEEVDFGWSLPLPPPPPPHNLVPKNFYFCIFCIYLINLNKWYIHNLNLDVFENLKNLFVLSGILVSLTKAASVTGKCYSASTPALS